MRSTIISESRNEVSKQRLNFWWGAEKEVAKIKMVLAKAAVVVGVSHMPGLGFAISKRFAQGGLKVGIIGRSKERLDAVKAEIEATVPGSEVVCAVADASDAAAVKAAFADLAEKHGSPEVLLSIIVL